MNASAELLLAHRVAQQTFLALEQNLTMMTRRLGVESVRAALVDLRSMAHQTIWSLTQEGETRDDAPGRSLGSAFPGATTTVPQLAGAPIESTIVRKLSPRRWLLAWRLDEDSGIVAEMHYLAVRPSLTAFDAAIVRLICGAGIRASIAAGAGQRAWPQVERRAAARAPLAGWLGLALILASALLGIWVAFAAVPQSQDTAVTLWQESARLGTMAERTLSRGLSVALATGDYGQVQESLSTFAELGYFQAASVTNARGRIVAMAGPLRDFRVGGEVPPAASDDARAFDLAVGSERYGELLLWPAAAAAAPALSAWHFNAPRIAGAVSSLLALTAGAMLLVLLLRRRRSRV